MALTDSDIHAPPTTGLYAHNTWTPANGSFPAVGGSYVDPVFGETIRRLTNNYTGSQANTENIYAHHWANADGTYVFSDQMRSGVYTGLFILNAMNGAEAYTSQPEGGVPGDIAWHPTDPDKYFYYSGAALVRRNLAAQTNTTIKTFAATLQTLGGTANWMDKTGRYMVVKYSDLIHVWDSVDDVIYSGTFTQIAGGSGWVGITPDGAYLVDSAGPSAQPAREHYSYVINHTTNTIASPVQFWGLSGDHMALVSASDGKNYALAIEAHDVAALYRIDISLNQSGRTAAQQRADNLQLIDFPWTTAGHYSGVSVGLTNWIFFSPEEVTTDLFNEVPTGWYAYENEIIAINLVTLEIRRLAHHRSRSINSSYYYFPRVSCSWDGSVVLWTSNYNISGITDYSDLYAIAFTDGTTPQPSWKTTLKPVVMM